MSSRLANFAFAALVITHSISTSVAAEKSMAVAGYSYTLDKAVATAMERSPTVLKSDSVADDASWKKVEAYSGFLPSLTVNGSHLFEKKYALIDIPFNGVPVSIPQIIPGSQFALTAELPIFDGFSSTNHLLSARSFQRGAEDDRDWTHFKSDREVTMQFYRALGAKLLNNVAVQNLKTIEDHLRDSRLFKKTGLSTNYDVLRVEVQKSEAESELLFTEDDVVTSRNKLAEMIGEEKGISDVEGSFPVMPANLLDHFKADSLASRLDLRAHAEREKAFNQAEASASTYWVPKVSLFYQNQYYNNLTDSFSDWNHYRDAYQLGVMASWNLFDGMKSFAHSKQSVEERKQAELDAQAARLSAKEDLEVWRRKFIYFTAVYRSRQNDIEKANESVRLAKEGRKVGARTNSDILDAEVELFRARAASVRAQVGAIEAILRLEIASGESIYKFH